MIKWLGRTTFVGIYINGTLGWQDKIRFYFIFLLRELHVLFCIQLPLFVSVYLNVLDDILSVIHVYSDVLQYLT